MIESSQITTLSKVLSKHLFGCMSEPIGEEKCIVLREGPIIEDEKEFSPVLGRVLGLDGMWIARREVP